MQGNGSLAISNKHIRSNFEQANMFYGDSGSSGSGELLAVVTVVVVAATVSSINNNTSTGVIPTMRKWVKPLSWAKPKPRFARYSIPHEHPISASVI
jgi:UDP-N-acetylmuramyl pentapeptide phosphotransferase/UDP-N-acetylglucosamine-1-phosphate transferase